MFNSKFTWKDFFKGFVIGLIAYFLFFSPTFSPFQQQKKQEIEWRTYNNTNVNVSIKYPGTWKVEENPPPGGFVVFIGPMKGGYVVNFAMGYHMLDDEVNQDNYFEKALEEDLKEMRGKDETFRLIDKEETIIDGKEALKLVFEFEHEVETTVRMKIIRIKCNNKSLLSAGGTFSSRVSEKYKPIFDHMINSIRC